MFSETMMIPIFSDSGRMVFSHNSPASAQVSGDTPAGGRNNLPVMCLGRIRFIRAAAMKAMPIRSRVIFNPEAPVLCWMADSMIRQWQTNAMTARMTTLR